MSDLYAKDGKLYCTHHMELYIPINYFENKIAINEGSTINTFGVLYVRSFPNGNEGPIRLFNVPTFVKIQSYQFRDGTISIHGKTIDVLVLEFIKDSYVLHQTIPNGREIAEQFLTTMLAGKLPKTLNYNKILDIWWKNLEIAGVNFKVPSKIFEMIIASIYRDPENPKKRYGQTYGAQANPSGYDYKTDSVRNVVRELSTFSGMIFEDIGTMISNGINNSLDEIEEPVSPLEKIIHY